jgi:capsular polysaccharide biosynthesis protein
MYINNRRSTTSIDQENVETKTLSSDITASQQLVPTYIEMLKSNSVLEEVSNIVEEKTHQKFSANKIRKMMTAEAVSNTEIIKVSIKMEDAAIARDIANTIAVVAEEKIPNFIQPSQVSIIDHAEASINPVSPNIRNSIILGALLGFVLSISFIVLKEIFDVRVKSTDDLVSRFEYPVLGTIPEIYVSYEDATFEEEESST